VNVNPSLFPDMIQNSAKLKQIWMNGNRNSKKRSSNTFVNTSMTSAELLERVQEAYPHTMASNEELVPHKSQETRQSQVVLKQQLNQNQYFPSQMYSGDFTLSSVQTTTTTTNNHLASGQKMLKDGNK
jgi:hypothetical protein